MKSVFVNDFWFGSDNQRVLSTCQSSRVIRLRFNSTTQRQMFLLLYGGHVCVPPRGTNMASPYKAL